MKFSRPKAWHIALCVVASCGFGGLLFSWITTNRANHDVAAATARLQALGVAFRPVDLVRQVPPADNAAPLYRQAIVLADSLKLPSSDFREARKFNYDLLARYVAAMKPVYALLDQAAERPDCDFAPDWKQGWRLKFDESYAVAHFSRDYYYRAILERHQGRWQAALLSVKTGLRVARHLNTPSPNDFFSQISCERNFLVELQRDLIAFGGEAEFRIELRSLLAAWPKPPSFRRSFPVQLLRLDAGCRDIRAFDEDQGDDIRADSTIKYLWRFESLRMATLAQCLNDYADIWEQTEKEPDNWRLLRDIMAKKSKEQDAQISIVSALRVAIGERWDTYAAHSVGRLDAHRRLTQVGLDLFEAKAKTGAFPPTLPPSASSDPFGTGAFVYRRSGPTFVLYSVGPNGIDDGGKAVDDVEFARPL